MDIGIIEMPVEKTWRVQLDGSTIIPGYLKRNVHSEGERYIVKFNRDGELEQLRTEPHSREGAACLLLFHHFEQERKRIRDAGANVERQRAKARKRAETTARKETSGGS